MSPKLKSLNLKRQLKHLRIKNLKMKKQLKVKIQYKCLYQNKNMDKN